MNTLDEEPPHPPRAKMAKLTIEQDMKLGSALDELEDAIEASPVSSRERCPRYT